MKPEEQARQQIDALLDAAIAADLKRAERLRQAILREAFAGRLVPQDLSDEPARVLLERIGQERKERARANRRGNERSQSATASVRARDAGEIGQASLWNSR